MIPRLELLAVLIGTRTAEFLQEVLQVPLESVTLWTDATTILQWLVTSEILQPFVQNRITEIRNGKNLQVHYVESEENPADMASRGKTPSALNKSELW